MRAAADARWRLRLPPLMNEVKKIIYSTSESGGFTTVALDLSGTGLVYEYGDVVKVILPNDDRQTRSWLYSLKSMNQEHFKLNDSKTNFLNGLKILDIGCGKGFFLKDLKDYNNTFQVHGVDISKYAIRNAHPDIKNSIIHSQGRRPEGMET